MLTASAVIFLLRITPFTIEKSVKINCSAAALNLFFQFAYLSNFNHLNTKLYMIYYKWLLTLICNNEVCEEKTLLNSSEILKSVEIWNGVFTFCTEEDGTIIIKCSYESTLFAFITVFLSCQNTKPFCLSQMLSCLSGMHLLNQFLLTKLT